LAETSRAFLLVEPYKSELLPHRRFKTVVEAKKSAATIYRMFWRL